MARRRFSELPPAARAAIIVAAVVQVTLLGAAHADLSRRTDAQVRGSKGVWRMLTLVNFVGPIAYFTAGRVPDADR